LSLRILQPEKITLVATPKMAIQTCKAYMPWLGPTMSLVPIIVHVLKLNVSLSSFIEI
jgi:hypothetical protein